MRLVGIDPGAAGALALFESGRLTDIGDMPTVLERKKRRVDAAALGVLLRQWAPDAIWLEHVHAMPGQGVSSMFAFGMAYGIVLGVTGALAVPLSTVAAAAWKTALRVPREKGEARARASALIPAGARYWPLVKHGGRAEAALIGLYGVRNGTPIVERW